jgi:peptidoglycan/LPS O-acetylase OafA/YrhL
VSTTAEPAPARTRSANEDLAPNLTPPPGNPRFPLLDSMRAIAALSVFAGHTVTETVTFAGHPTPFIWATQIADEGVAIFFLISGFLLYRPFLTARRTGSRLRLADYARRRVLRIVPAYWVALTIFIVLGWVGGVSRTNWWVFYGFGQIYSPSTLGGGIGVAWTLCIEVSFYALLPVFAAAAAWLGRWRRPVGTWSVRGDVVLLIVLAGGSLAFRAHFSSFLDTEKVSTLAGTFFWFALGMGLAVASVNDARPPRRVPWPVASWVLAAVAFVALHEVASSGSGFGLAAATVTVHVLYGIAALLILLPAVFEEERGGAVRAILRHRSLVWVGLISYAFYLYHTIVLAQLNQLFGGLALGTRYVLVALLALAGSLVCAAVSYYALERPAMRWGRGRRRRGRP